MIKFWRGHDISVVVFFLILFCDSWNLQKYKYAVSNTEYLITETINKFQETSVIQWPKKQMWGVEMIWNALYTHAFFLTFVKKYLYVFNEVYKLLYEKMPVVNARLSLFFFLLAEVMKTWIYPCIDFNSYYLTIAWDSAVWKYM